MDNASPLRKRTIVELDRLTVEQYARQPKHPLVAVLENIRSLHNVGSIFRSADAFALRQLHLCGFTGQPPHPEIHKSALGSTDSVVWQHWPDPLACLRQLKADGYRLLALEQTHNSILLTEAPHLQDQPMALVLGNEVRGVSDEALALCDGALEIPQFGTKHSLNVAVAAGIAFFELTRTHTPK